MAYGGHRPALRDPFDELRVALRDSKGDRRTSRLPLPRMGETSYEAVKSFFDAAWRRCWRAMLAR
jgi:hypothetical protein